MSTKTIKDVNEKTWRKLRILSAEYDIPMGKLIEKITEDYEARNKEFWNSILKGEKLLSDKEAEEMLAVVRGLRKECGFR